MISAEAATATHCLEFSYLVFSLFVSQGPVGHYKQ